jgi:DNA adenine methylase
LQRGKFLLSSYKNKNLDVCSERQGWSKVEIKMASSMSNRYDKPKIKTEVLTANYPISVKLDKNNKEEVTNGEEEKTGE